MPTENRSSSTEMIELPNTHRVVTIPACPDHGGFHSITVMLPWTCRACGAPRGEPYKSISYDGSRRLAVHSWNNQCGHVEKYKDVISDINLRT